MKHLKKLTISMVLLLILVGCKKTDTNETITIGLLQNYDSIPYIIAYEKGYFEEQGLQIELEHFNSAMDRDAALQTNNLAGATADMLAVNFLRQSGFEVVITSKTEGLFKIIGNDTITNLADNATVGISKNTIIELITDAYSDTLDTITVEKVEIPKMPTRLEMFNAGKITLVTLPEPLASLAESESTHLLKTSDDLDVNPAIMLFTQDFLSKQDDTFIDSFHTAYNQAIDYLLSHEPSEYEDLLIEKANFPEGIRGIMILPTYSYATLPDKKQWDLVSDWMLEKELIKQKIDFEEVILK